MKITVELELSSPYDLTAEEVEKDIRLSEERIGWNYDYSIRSVNVDKGDFNISKNPNQ